MYRGCECTLVVSAGDWPRGSLIYWGHGLTDRKRVGITDEQSAKASTSCVVAAPPTLTHMFLQIAGC